MFFYLATSATPKRSSHKSCGEIFLVQCALMQSHFLPNSPSHLPHFFTLPTPSMHSFIATPDCRSDYSVSTAGILSDQYIMKLLGQEPASV